MPHDEYDDMLGSYYEAQEEWFQEEVAERIDEVVDDHFQQSSAVEYRTGLLPVGPTPKSRRTGSEARLATT